MFKNLKKSMIQALAVKAAITEEKQEFETIYTSHNPYGSNRTEIVKRDTRGL